jgi:hypothetical protein
MRCFSGGARRRPTRALAAALGAVFFMSALLAADPVRADAGATTHRPGDLIVYRFACHDADSMIALAERGGVPEMAAALVSQGKCFQGSGCIAARLEGWVAGPYPPPRGTPGSVWRVRDQLGDTEFVWIDDAGGPHAAGREMAL